MMDPVDVLAEATLAALLREGHGREFATEEDLLAWADRRLRELTEEMVAGTELN